MMVRPFFFFNSAAEKVAGIVIPRVSRSLAALRDLSTLSRAISQLFLIYSHRVFRCLLANFAFRAAEFFARSRSELPPPDFPVALLRYRDEETGRGKNFFSPSLLLPVDSGETWNILGCAHSNRIGSNSLNYRATSFRARNIVIIFHTVIFYRPRVYGGK